MIFQPAAGGAGKQCPGTVTENPHDHEQQTENDHLQRDVTPGYIDELRQECEKKQRGLGIQHIHNDTLPENSTEGFPHTGLLAIAEIPLHEFADTEVNQICGAQKFEHAEGRRGCCQQCRDAERRRGNMKHSAEGHAEGRYDARQPALVDAPGDDVEHRGTRRNQNHESRDEIQGQPGRIHHDDTIFLFELDFDKCVFEIVDIGHIVLDTHLAKVRHAGGEFGDLCFILAG